MLVCIQLNSYQINFFLRHEDHDEIRKLFPTATFSYIEDAGHWLHADQPYKFLEAVIPLV